MTWADEAPAFAAGGARLRLGPARAAKLMQGALVWNSSGLGWDVGEDASQRRRFVRERKRRGGIGKERDAKSMGLRATK
jgi:hypothetical protein